MTTQEFEKTYWKYYLLLENDFLSTEKYVTLDNDNAKAFSMEYMKIFQMICAEIDVCAKVFCKHLQNDFGNDTLPHYGKIILTKYPNLVNDEVLILPINESLTPWQGWAWNEGIDKNGNVRINGTGPKWWSEHNKVKHSRTLVDGSILNYKKANQNNVINALAALFQVEMYFYNLLADNENLERKTPLPKSKLFSIPRWTNTVSEGWEMKFSLQGNNLYINN